MKTHTNDFKNAIKQFGKEIDSKITYTDGGQTIELGKEDLNSITPHYEGSILKSTMRQLDIDSNVEIPLETIINYQFGLKVGNEYEYLNYGNYVVYKVEKQEDTNSYKLTCYDKMLYSMIPYEALSITYPITIRNYLGAICSKLGLTFKNASDTFANYDKEIASELYLDSEGNSLDYTFRDVLDEIAGATGSTICIDEETDMLEVRYINNTGEKTTVEGTNISIENSEDAKIDLELQGDTTQDGTPTPDAPIEVQTVTGRQVINVSGTDLLDNTTWTTGKYLKENNTEGSNSGWKYSDYIDIEGGKYIYKCNLTGNAPKTLLYDSSKNVIQVLDITSGVSYDLSQYNAKYIRLSTTTNQPSTVRLEKDYEVNLGKNLYKPFSYTRTSQGVVYTYNEDGTLTASGTATGTSSVSITRADAYANGWYYSLSPGTYTLSGGIDNTKRLQVITADTGTSVAITGASGTATFTINNYTIVYLRATTSNGTEVNGTFYPQIEKGSQATNWSAYKKPIKLCKLGTTFIDKINKSTGKNLLNPYNLNIERNGITATYDADTQTFTFNGTCTADNTTFRMADNDIQFIEGKTRSISYWQGGTISGYCLLRHFDENYASSCNYDISTLSSNNPTKYATSQSTFTSPSTRTGIRFNNGSVADNFKIKVMVYDITNQTQDYEPYGNSWYIARKTFIFDKDNLDDMTITKRNDGDGTNTITFNINGTGGFTLGSSADWLSNYFPRSQTSTSGIEGYGSDSQRFRAFLQVNRSRLSSLDIAGFKEYFKSTGVELYCTINGTTVYEPITDEELINQLNAVELFEGINNISISSEDLISPLSISYYNEIDTIDEEYLKDINVNFGEKYGPVNSIVLSRAAESDNIYLRNEVSVQANGLCEIKIKDNQIMNNNDRYQFLPELLDKLSGLEYYINDFTSPGIMYYNLCDRYNIQIGENKYKCILFNDEANITQGLEENIYTEMPEETKTDYTKADKTDRKIKQAYIIVDKQNQQIDSVVQNVDTLRSMVNSQGDDINTLGTRLTQTTENITASVSAIQGEIENGVGLVKTTSVTIDDDGLSVSTDTSKIKTTMSNNEFKITDSGNTELAKFGYDETEQISVANMDNLTVDKYLTVGNHRAEEYQTNRTGWFYIGG